VNLAPPPPFPVRPRPVSGLGTAAIVLLGFALLPYALRIVVSWLPYRVTIVVLDGDVSVDTRQPDILSAMLLASNVLFVPAVLAATVTALGWIHRAPTPTPRRSRRTCGCGTRRAPRSACS
jgi:hypothetical protein